MPNANAGEPAFNRKSPFAASTKSGSATTLSASNPSARHSASEVLEHSRQRPGNVADTPLFALAIQYTFELKLSAENESM
jgi:hypothetical protein